MGELCRNAPLKLGLEAWGWATRELARMGSCTSLASRRFDLTLPIRARTGPLSAQGFVRGCTPPKRTLVGTPAPCVCKTAGGLFPALPRGWQPAIKIRRKDVLKIQEGVPRYCCHNKFCFASVELWLIVKAPNQWHLHPRVKCDSDRRKPPLEAIANGAVFMLTAAFR